MKIMKSIGEGKFELIDKHLDEMSKIISNEMPIVSKNKNNIKVEETSTKKFESKSKQEAKTSTGENVKFKDEWNGHKFTEEELEKLLAGETIDIFDKKFKNKKGQEYGVRGKFAWQEYKGHRFYGFKLQEFLNMD